MRHVWILGSGGLLGSAMKQSLSEEKQVRIFTEPTPLSWADKTALNRELCEAVDCFAKIIGKDDSWEVYWMAGRSIMSSERTELEQETSILSLLLERIDTHPSICVAEGTIIFASSAGGVYAGSTEETISELSVVSPLSAYGEEKLKQEELIRTWAKSHPTLSVLIARISTLYGPKQSQGKKQGLLTHIARCILRKEPVEIFVPFDTIRDYIHVRDAVEEIKRALENVRGTHAVTMKIVASEEPTTVAQIIQLFRHVTRVRPRIVTSSNPRSSHYARRMCFKSSIFPSKETKKRTSLLLGIAEILSAERLAMAKGK